VYLNTASESAGIEVFAIQPPHEYIKKSEQGSTDYIKLSGEELVDLFYTWFIAARMLVGRSAFGEGATLIFGRLAPASAETRMNTKIKTAAVNT
jgi:hypothetical protein